MKLTSESIYDKEKNIKVYIFRLSKFGKYHEFFIKDKNLYEKLLQILRLYCISSDFDAHYKIGEKIGYGHFAKVFQYEFLKVIFFKKVYRVIKKDCNAVFAAKVIEKNQKLQDQKVLLFISYVLF